MNSSSNTIHRLDATFGSRRGTILQQYPESAHRLNSTLSLTRYQIGVGLEPIDGAHPLGGMWKKNKIPFFSV